MFFFNQLYVGTSRAFGAGCSCVPAAVVEDEGDVERQVDGDAEDAELDGGAEAGGDVELDELPDHGAALLVGRHVDLELEQHQHVGAHLEVGQRVRRARVAAGRGGLAADPGDQEEVQRQEERRETCCGFGRHCFDASPGVEVHVRSGALDCSVG
uniref:Uncharacterized protein n=1 Tax=Triticum urartu TaxID=4572 RepID=A0A8R7U565_TRIUA